MRAPLLLGPALLALACRTEGTLIREIPEVTLRIDSPTYGQFMGDDTVEVRGVVSPARATVTIEGEAIPVAEDGSFEAVFPIDHAYRIVDVEASVPSIEGDIVQTERIPVFRLHDPAETWPGGSVARLTPGGLDAIGRTLGAGIDALGWEDQLLAALPTFDLGFLTVTPTGIDHAPTVVYLVPGDGGVEMDVTLVDVTLTTEVTVDVQGQPLVLPATFTYDEVAIGATLVPGLDDAGVVTLSVTDGDITFGQPVIDVAGIGGLGLDFLLQGLTALVEPFGEVLLDSLLAQFDGLPLGGPFAFQAPLFGTTLDVRLSDLYTDPDGVALDLGVGIGGPAAEGPLGLPAPVDPDPAVHAAIGLHEYLLDLALSEQLVGALSQDLDLGGLLGNVIGVGIRALPGGDEAPEGDGWCLSIDPGTARVVRLHPSIAPLATLYLPDVFVDVGVLQGDTCEAWLQASLAMEVDLDVRDGTAVGISMAVPEGAVLAYGADADSWTEDAVIEGLGGFIVTSTELFAGNFSFDLADLLGGLGGAGIPGLDGVALAPRLVGSAPILDEGGVHLEGYYGIGLSLFAEPAP